MFSFSIFLHLFNNTAGHDIKSLLINVAMTVFFILPFGAYYYREYTNEQIYFVLLTFFLAYVAPPLGCLRPHPYTDHPEYNRPYAPNIKYVDHAIKQD